MLKIITLSCMLASFTASGNTLIKELRLQILEMAEGGEITLTYNFEGCFGPYHHGEVEMKLSQDTIYYVHSSFDEVGKQPFNQAGKYQKDHLLNLLSQALEKKASVVLGNRINFQLSSSTEILAHGSDHIEQRHFIELFHPFINIFKPTDPEIIPKLKTGGFVH